MRWGRRGYVKDMVGGRKNYNREIKGVGTGNGELKFGRWNIDFMVIR